MAVDSDPLERLAPLFAAERLRLLSSLEDGVRRLMAAEQLQARLAAIDSIARDAHALKGAAQIEPRAGGADPRVELCALVGEVEEYLAVARDATAPAGEGAALLAALVVMRRLSSGRAATADLVRARAGLQAVRAAASR